MAREALKRRGSLTIWFDPAMTWEAVPNFSTLSRRQKTLKVNIPYRGSAGPLHLLIDRTGIKVEGEGEWSEADQKTVRGTVFPPNA